MEPTINRSRHISYWTRCYKSVLPTPYASTDSTRMTFGCFILSALDLLTSPSEIHPSSPPFLTPTDRTQHTSWVLALQHPSGGFAGSPNQLLPFCTHKPRIAGPGSLDLPEDERGAPEDSCANLAATFFALSLLALVAEEDGAKEAFKKVQRQKTLTWLRRLQREDGSFGEVVDGQGRISGGRDMRYCYLAAAVRWFLRGDHEEGSEHWVDDINVDNLIRHIRRAQTYDGGISESGYNESHAGYAYCAIAALILLGAGPDTQSPSGPPSTVISGVRNLPKLLQFLVYRQQSYLTINPEASDDEETEVPPSKTAVPGDPETLMDGYIGFNGRQNKPSDTCYFWWAGATLNMLGHNDVIDALPARRFLVNKTQHMIGGFGKTPGDRPDLYHSYLGLAALATMGDPTLAPFDPVLCITRATVKKIIAAREGMFL